MQNELLCANRSGELFVKDTHLDFCIYDQCDQLDTKFFSMLQKEVLLELSSSIVYQEKRRNDPQLQVAPLLLGDQSSRQFMKSFRSFTGRSKLSGKCLKAAVDKAW